MYDLQVRRRALAFLAEGHSLNATSRATGVSRAAIREWATHGPEPSSTGRAPLRTDGPAYPYLLGLYLGDGCLSRGRRGVYALRIACADSWPGLISACERAIHAVRPGGSVCRAQQQGCVQVTACSKQWPAIFPQHGPGRKHERRIVLEAWQQPLVDAYPWEFIRGLVHSDGCRITNWTTRVVGGELRRYEYPRYFFTNKSEDILTLFSDALDLVGVQWKVTRRAGRPYNVSVARRASVALMDLHIGPKH
ncbi:transcriptional regulator [Streptomyces sp. NBC_01477]|uniref:transcriptional regulator n=1 Tax=Streptomyces sp. NBC_01477 TaxID=2976015 RepID=UPI002E3417B7|nr:transcriptional regulator [Streptomyces sp. NBC_01477]